MFNPQSDRSAGEPRFRRLSRRNEYGSQGTVTDIAVDPFDARVIPGIDRPTSGGSAMYRSTDGGLTWESLLERFHLEGRRYFGPEVDPTCVVFHPSVRNAVYMGAGDMRALYLSRDGGTTWEYLGSPGGRLRKLVVDGRRPRLGEGLGTTELYAGTDDGLYYSGTHGVTWDRKLGGEVWSMSALFPLDAPPDFFVGTNSDLWHSSVPGAPGSVWRTLTTDPAIVAGGVGEALPMLVGDRVRAVLVDRCRQAPNRVYVCPPTPTWITRTFWSAAALGFS